LSAALTAWAGSLHQTFRLLPKVSDRLVVFLESDRRTPDEVLAALPYDAARSSRGAGTPDHKRYRDPKQVFQTAGLLYEGEDDLMHVTELGRTTLRFLKVLNEANAPVLGAHAAYALAGCQLRNPTGAGARYDESVEVFPFAFIWRAMLELGQQITSDELNREIFRTRNEDDLEQAIDNIRQARAKHDPDVMRPPVITGKAVNDRIIPWIALAGFGYTLILDKSNDPERTYYRIRPDAVAALERASTLRLPHREFRSTAEYVEYISTLAGLSPVVASVSRRAVTGTRKGGDA
jgi:hypothetical protein